MEYLFRHKNTNRLFVATKYEVEETIETLAEGNWELFDSGLWGYGSELLGGRLDKLRGVSKNKEGININIYSDGEFNTFDLNTYPVEKFIKQYLNGSECIYFLTDSRGYDIFKPLNSLYCKTELKLVKEFKKVLGDKCEYELVISGLGKIPIVGVNRVKVS